MLKATQCLLKIIGHPISASVCFYAHFNQKLKKMPYNLNTINEKSFTVMRNFASVFKYIGIALLLVANPTAGATLTGLCSTISCGISSHTVTSSPMRPVTPTIPSYPRLGGGKALKALGGNLAQLAPNSPMKLGVLPVTALINSNSSTVGGTTFSTLASNFMQGSQLNMQQLGGTSGATINAGSATAASNSSALSYLTGANLTTALGRTTRSGAAVLKPPQSAAVINSTNNTMGALRVNLADTVGAGTLGNTNISNSAIVQGGTTFTGNATGSQNQTSIEGNPNNPNS